MQIAMTHSDSNLTKMNFRDEFWHFVHEHQDHQEYGTKVCQKLY